MLKITLPSLDKIKSSLSNILISTDYENATFFTGGCVRNHLLHRDISDVDLYVDLPEGAVKLAEYLYQLGLGSKPVLYKHTGTVRTVFHGTTLEISTAHQAAPAKPSHEVRTEPASLAGDALRRDFTINSLYMNLQTGDILDPTGYGLVDLKKGMVRTVVFPDLVFKADSIRILRGIRFAAEFGFTIEDNTWQAMLKLKNNLKLAAPERVKNEFILMLYGSDPANAFRLLANSSSFSIVAPEFSFWLGRQGTISEAGLSSIEALKSCQHDSLSRWLCILKEILLRKISILRNNAADEDLIPLIRRDFKKLLKSYYLSEHFINKLLTVLIAYATLVIQVTGNKIPETKELRRLLFGLGNSFELLKHMSVSNNQITSNVDMLLQHQICRIEELLSKESDLVFPLNGRLIMDAMGVSSGPAIGILLARAKEYWFANPTLNGEEIIRLLTNDNISLAKDTGTDEDVYPAKSAKSEQLISDL